MTVAVVKTREGVEKVRDADDLKVDEGVLIVDDENGKYIAVFAPGSWYTAVLQEDTDEATLDPDREPRVWQSLVDVPAGTLVESRKLSEIDEESLKIRLTEVRRAEYKWDWQSEWTPCLIGAELDIADGRYGPFTEVIK